MKVAVIGGGTAGYMAAAHLTKSFPMFDLYHIYDPSIPTARIGEGTVPIFKTWLHEITGLSFSELQTRCYITRKYGIRFENWGERHQFMHNFWPIGEDFSYHISAPKIVELLKGFVSSHQISKRVIELDSNGYQVDITFKDKTHLEVDFAYDARGFPKSLSREHVELSIIPTNAALVKYGDPVDLKLTRAVARPYGWVFVIPLTTYTSYGYIFNNSINTRNEIEDDFTELLHSENVNLTDDELFLQFPNFVSRSFFDGALFKIGNAGSFLEPLESTAIAVTQLLIEGTSYWPLTVHSLVASLLSSKYKRGRVDEVLLESFNQTALDHLRRISWFIGWHYSMGSAFDTEFWKFAKSNFFREIEKTENKRLLIEFRKFLNSGIKIARGKSHKLFGERFGGYRARSFAEIGQGIGYFK